MILMKHCSILVCLALSSLVLVNVPSVHACGSWPSIVDEDSGVGLPTPASNSGTNQGIDWSWAITGSTGSYSASAEVDSGWIWYWYDEIGTGLHSAQGYKKKRQPTFVEQQPVQCHHTAPTDARADGSISGRVTGSLDADSDNDDPTQGRCDGTAYANVTFSGVVSGSCEINIAAWVKEAGGTVGGSLTSDGDLTVEFESEYGGDTYGTGTKVNTVTSTGDYTGNIGNKIQQGHGTVSIAASVTNGADHIDTAATTEILTNDLTKGLGGTGTDATHGNHSH